MWLPSRRLLPYFFLFRFSTKGAGSTTLLQRWSEAPFNGGSRFEPWLELKLWAVAEAWSQGAHHPDHSDLFSTSLIFHVIIVWFYHHCKSHLCSSFKIIVQKGVFLKRQWKCFQVTDLSAFTSFAKNLRNFEGLQIYTKISPLMDYYDVLFQRFSQGESKPESSIHHHHEVKNLFVCIY